MPIDSRPTIAAPDDDPHLWLEDIDGPDALRWVDEQNVRTLKAFGGPEHEADTRALATILDRPDNLPLVTRRGGWLYNFWRDAQNPRGLWRRTTMASFATETPDWDIVIDIDALAHAEGEDWIWQGAATNAPDHDRAFLRLSRGGSDAVELREFDLVTKVFPPDGFHLPTGKGGIDWIDRDTLLVCFSHGEGMATTSGYARSVRRLRRGQSLAEARVIFEIPQDHMAAWAHVDRTGKHERIWYFDRTGFFDGVFWLGDRTGPHEKLDLPTGIGLDIHGDWLAIKPREPFSIDRVTYPADCVLGIALDEFLSGSRDFSVLFEPGERRIIDNLFWNGERLVLSILDNLQPVFESLTPSCEGWRRDTISGAPAIGHAVAAPVFQADAERNGDLFLTTQDPITPPTLSLIEAGKPPAILKRAPQAFDASNLVVTRHEAVAVDGERIPYVQVGPEDAGADAPVHMTGYGGFGASSLPFYSTAIGKLWLERGGVSVRAQIRGGGEFGVRWHEAGRRENKPKSHDDFAAVAADLVVRGVTIPQRIAAEGGSNGGILITNMLTRYPQRFGALFCTIPLIDMRRYAKLLAGASWIAEYGDPEIPEDWAFLQRYSAYHTAEPGQTYPPILLATARRDDRVHPGHAHKMTAKLQAMGYENVWFYEPAAGGHGYGKDNAERAAFTALGYRLLREKIDWR